MGIEQQLHFLVNADYPLILFIQALNPFAETFFRIEVKVCEVMMDQRIALQNKIVQHFLLLSYVSRISIDAKPNTDEQLSDGRFNLRLQSHRSW